MARPQPGLPEPVPRWLMIGGSVVIAGHLLAVLLLVLNVPSGPWPSPMGPSPALPPQFAHVADDFSTPKYLQPLGLAQNFHFASNRVATPEAYIEVRLKDATGKVTQTLRFPDENANFWVRQRQYLLAKALTEDIQLPPPQGESVAAPGQKVHKVPIWDMDEKDPNHLYLREVPEHLVPRNRPVWRPSDWMLLLVRSYARHLCREHGAASAQVIRHSHNSLAPVFLFFEELPRDAFQELVSDFGEQSK